MKSLSVATLIKALILIGLLAIFTVIVQSCGSSKQQNSKDQIDIAATFANGSLSKLKVLEDLPPQPRLSFKTPNGSEMALSDFKGDYLLVNIWATWCPPCIVEMPSLNNLADLRKNDLQLVTISMDQTAEDAAEFIRKNNLENLEPWHDNSMSIGAKLGVRGLPITVIYDKNGEEIVRLEGPAEWDSPEALALIDHIIGG